MTASLRRDIETIFRSALESVRADRAVRTNLVVGARDELIVSGRPVDIGSDGVYAIAIGKAAVGMTEAAAGSIGERFTAGLAVTKAEVPSLDSRITVMEGSHPVPDARSLAAGDAVLRFADAVPVGALVLCLISGGGSSLVENLREDVSLARLRELTSELLNAGASIHELNAVRTRLSRFKGGGLLRALNHTRVCNLIVSDVLGDNLQTIASGPTVPSLDVDADSVMQRYRIDGTIPDALSGATLLLPPTTIIANLSTALDTAARAAAELGYSPVVLTRSLEGEARESGRLLAAMLVDGASGKTTFGGRTCLLAGGETTVTVRGNGIGGRNTEAALASAVRLSGQQGAAIGFLATDGDDGATGAAGGIVDGGTVGDRWRHDAIRALANNDSFSFLRARGSVLVTGPTGTNVNDLVIGLIA